MKILKDPRVTRIIIEHKDRLTRFGYHYIAVLCEILGIELVVINHVDNDERELAEDLISVVTSFCARLYGRRRAQRKTEILTKELLEGGVDVGKSGTSLNP